MKMDNIDERSMVTRVAANAVAKRNAGLKKKDRSYWYDANFNPFGKRIGDCLVRAVSAALMMRYETVCARLGIRFKDGHGLESQSGVVIERIWRSSLRRYFEPAETYRQFSLAFRRGRPRCVKKTLTVSEFIEKNMEREASPEAGPGIYLLGVGRPGSKQPSHGLYVCVEDKDGFFIDTFDSGRYQVFRAFKVKYQVGKNNPERLRYREFKMIQDVYRKLEAQGWDVDDFFDMIDGFLVNSKDQDSCVEYELGDDLKKWLECTTENQITEFLEHAAADRLDVKLDPTAPSEARKRLAAEICNGEHGDVFPYSLKKRGSFDKAYYDPGMDTLYFDVKGNMDLIDLPYLKSMKKGIFRTLKELDLIDSIKAVVYHHNLKDGHGCIWVDFAGVEGLVKQPDLPVK